MNTKIKPMRDTMPTVAAVIDDLRAAFGADAINPAIKGGMAGVPTFYARENGHEVGTPLDLGGRVVVCGADMVIHPISKEDIARGNKAYRP